MSIGVSDLIHLNGHIFPSMIADGFLQFRVLIRVLELISVPNESERFIYFNKIQHFVHMEGDCQCPLELVV